MVESKSDGNQHLKLSSAKDLIYVNEGGANVIFRWKRFSPSSNCYLIRLRKESKKFDSSDACDSLLFLEHEIIPRLGRNAIVDHRHLIIENSQHVLKVLNAMLRNMERIGTRPLMRHGTYLNEYMADGLLVEDMIIDGDAFKHSIMQLSSPLADWHIDTRVYQSINPFGKLFCSNIYSSEESSCFRKSLLAEWKPKWLGQSPDAPVNSLRCRNCALRRYRHTKEGVQLSSSLSCHLGQAVLNDDPPCPLALLSEDPQRVGKLASTLLAPNPPSDNESFLLGLSNEILGAMGKVILLHTPVFRSLKAFQDSLDKRGVLSLYGQQTKRDEELSDQFTDLSLAMALRDCSAYLLFWQDMNPQYQADLKVRYPESELQADLLHNDDKLSAYYDSARNIYLFKLLTTANGSNDLTNTKEIFVTAKLRLGDFDRKLNKVDHWYASERELVEGEWYVKR